MTAMNRYLAGVLSVIAVGMVMIAYSLVSSGGPAAAVQSMGMPAQAVMVNGAGVPVATGMPVMAAPMQYVTAASMADRGVAAMPVTYAATEPMVVRTMPQTEAVRTVMVEPAPRRIVSQRVSRSRVSGTTATAGAGGTTTVTAGAAGRKPR